MASGTKTSSIPRVDPRDPESVSRAVVSMAEMLNKNSGQFVDKDGKVIDEQILINLGYAQRVNGQLVRKDQSTSPLELERSFNRWLSERAEEVLVDPFQSVEFTIGAESGNVINVLGQLIDENDNEIAGVHYLTVYLSDAATGIGVTGTAPAANAIATYGTLMITHTAVRFFDILTDADGKFDFNIQYAGIKTWYMVVVVDSNEVVVSSAITFA